MNYDYFYLASLIIYYEINHRFNTDLWNGYLLFPG